MRTTILFILLFTINIAMAQNQPIISGVETFGQWDSAGAGELPRYWDGFNRQINVNGMNLGEVICVTKDSTDPKDMDYSVRLENKSILGAGAVPGILTCGKLDINFVTQNGDINGGVPYSQKPASLKGWYKYDPKLGDTAIISVWFKQGGQNIGGGSIKINNKVSLWTEFDVNLFYQPGSQPDTIIIMFSSSNKKHNVPLGSVLDIDHIWLEGGSLSSNDIKAESLKINIFPNPASKQISINIPKNNKHIAVKIYDNTSKIVLETNFNSQNTKLDISKLTSGIYYLEIVSKSIRKIKRIIIK